MLPDDGSCNLERDLQSTTHQVCIQGSPEKLEDHDCSVTYEDQNSIIFLVKECQEAESSGNMMRKSASSDHNHQPLDKLESCDDQFSNAQKKRERSCLGEGAEENNDGFQTPTKFMDYESSSSGFRCPPAPRKPKAEPLAKRRRVCRRNLQAEFLADVELGLRLLAGQWRSKLKEA